MCSEDNNPFSSLHRAIRSCLLYVSGSSASFLELYVPDVYLSRPLRLYNPAFSCHPSEACSVLRSPYGEREFGEKKKKKALQSHYTCWHWPCNSVEVACLQRLEKFICASAVDRLKAHCVVLGEDILIRRGRIVIDTNKLSAHASLNNLTLKDNFIPFHFVFFKLFWGPCFPQRTACLLSYGKDEYFWVCLISSLVLLKLSLNVFSKTT